MQETWKHIPGYQTFYEASTLGNIRRVGSTSQLKFGIDTGGYQVVCLSVLGKSKTQSVHRLVAITFLPKKVNKKQVNHINGNKLDNCVENLEWCTPSYNTIHAFILGKAKSNLINWKHK